MYMYIIVMLDTEPEMEESSYKLELSRAHSIVWQYHRMHCNTCSV